MNDGILVYIFQQSAARCLMSAVSSSLPYVSSSLPYVSSQQLVAFRMVIGRLVGRLVGRLPTRGHRVGERVFECDVYHLIEYSQLHFQRSS